MSHDGSDEDARQGASCDFSTWLKRLRRGIQKRNLKNYEGQRDRIGQTHSVDFLEWRIVAGLLDRVVPEWSYAIRGIVQIGEFVVVTAAITINGVTREGTGTGSVNGKTGIKKAEHDALKRAAAKFGVARKFYRDEERSHDPKQNEADDNQQTGQIFDLLAKTASGLISLKQLLLINTLAKRAQLDPEVLCHDTYKARLGEISQRAASVLIYHLQTLASPITQ